jgi:aminoglycoside phosphotransferase (APT) family kinase protein
MNSTTLPRAQRSELGVLERVIGERLSLDQPRIVSMRTFTEGWSMETFGITVEHGSPDDRFAVSLILRREPLRGLLEPYDVARECRVIAEVRSAGVPAPEVHFVEHDPGVFERPFGVLSAVEGFVPEITVADSDDCFSGQEQLRASLGEQFVRILAQVHSIDLAGGRFDFIAPVPHGNAAALDQVAHWEEVIARAGYRDASVAFAIEWLKANAPETQAPALLHSDYRTGNYIVHDDRIAAVLDWEMAHLGDIHEDLCFALDAMWQSPGDRPKVSHLLEREAFLERYSALSGRSVSPRRLLYFEVLLRVKAVGIAATAASACTAGELANLRLARFGYYTDTFRGMVIGSLSTAIGRLR